MVTIEKSQYYNLCCVWLLVYLFMLCLVVSLSIYLTLINLVYQLYKPFKVESHKFFVQ
jgi:hypothetical protein